MEPAKRSLMDLRGTFEEVVKFADTHTLEVLSPCCRVAQSAAVTRRRTWEQPLEDWSKDGQRCLRETLGSLWKKHQGLIRQKGAKFNKIQSAADMYRCWPSKDWFGEGEVPWKEYWDFEFGDSSYNIWIFDLPVAILNLERIFGDLYLRMRWPKAGSKEATEVSLSSCEAFVERLTTSREWQEGIPNAMEVEDGRWDPEEDFDFTLKPISFFMEQIWWSDTRVCRWFNRPRQTEFMDPRAGTKDWKGISNRKIHGH
eukprot:s2217_g2.t1